MPLCVWRAVCVSECIWVMYMCTDVCAGAERLGVEECMHVQEWACGSECEGRVLLLCVRSVYLSIRVC